jgi:hypothetical protein
MHQFQRLARPRRPQSLDDAETHAAAAMHRDTCRLIDHQQMLVLKNDRSLDQFQQAGRRLPKFIAGIDPHRRQADFVPCLNAVFRIDALAVDAYLTLAQQPVDPAAGHGLEVPHEEIVDSLTRLIGCYRAQGYGTFRSTQGFRHCHISVHGFTIFAEQSSKVLITLTLTGCRDSVLKPCQALNHFWATPINLGPACTPVSVAPPSYGSAAY